MRCLHQDKIAGGMTQRGSNRRTFSLVLQLPKQLDFWMRGNESFENFAGSVGRTIVDQNDLALEPFRQRRFQNLC